MLACLSVITDSRYFEWDARQFECGKDEVLFLGPMGIMGNEEKI